jgi:hypothetical protein
VYRSATTDAAKVSGRILDPQGNPVGGAHLKLLNSAGTLIRQVRENRICVGANFLIAGGYTGQTPEALAVPTDAASFSASLERVVGVPLKSYVSVSWSYPFKK